MLKPRLEALKCGDRKYQGQPCGRGHSGERYVTSRACVQCEIERTQKGIEMRRVERETKTSSTDFRHRILMLGTYQG